MSATGLLQRMAASSRARVRGARAREPESALLRRASAMPAPPPLVLDGFDLIAELKLRSPAAGGLADAAFDRLGQIRAYAEAGAAAVSVLTEPSEFAGSLDDLRAAAAALTPHRLPVMRKDFLTEPYQVLEARAEGAGGVLIIVTMLSDAEVGALLAAAAEQGLFALLEAFDANDLERIGALGPRDGGPAVLAGVNCRNLATLEVDFDRFAALAPLLPRHLPVVAESGIGEAADVARVASLGYRLALVGSSLMRAADPRVAAAQMIAAGRAAARRPGAA
jgi:indole-3-glycerol phosphate synthase